MAKVEHGTLDSRGKFHPASTPNPTRVGRGSLAKGNTGHLDSALATAQAHALQTGRRATVATRVTGDDGSVAIVEHGKVGAAMKGATVAGSGSQVGRSTSNTGI